MRSGEDADIKVGNWYVSTTLWTTDRSTMLLKAKEWRHCLQKTCSHGNLLGSLNISRQSGQVSSSFNFVIDFSRRIFSGFEIPSAIAICQVPLMSEVNRGSSIATYKM